MLSLYVHVPFCDKKCGYCSFHVLETEGMRNENSILDHYISSLKAEIKNLHSIVGKEELQTIYFGGGTPSKLGVERVLDLVSYIDGFFDLDVLGEISFECNPYPEEDTLYFVRALEKELKHFPRIRFSFGLQSFDDEILKESGREHSFNQNVHFLRELQSRKQANSVYNLDFIAFGKFKTLKSGEQQLRDQPRLDFFQGLVESHFADSFSLYTLELFEGSIRYHDLIRKTDKKTSGSGLQKYGSDDDIYKEFSMLKDIISASGYRRYELSNFSLPGKSSLHNRAYREMENYIGVGTSAASFVSSNYKHYDAICGYLGIEGADGGVRWTNTRGLSQYLKGEYVDGTDTQKLDQDDILIESFFLGLRTDSGVKNISGYKKILVDNYEEILEQLVEQGFVLHEEQDLFLTDTGMDVFNEIVTNLIKKI